VLKSAVFSHDAKFIWTWKLQNDRTRWHSFFLVGSIASFFFFLAYDEFFIDFHAFLFCIYRSLSLLFGDRRFETVLNTEQIVIDILETFNTRLTLRVIASYLDPGGFGDSRQCLKEGGSTPQTPITGNHLDVPRSLDPNPNLLSPEILTQRRGQLLRWCNITMLSDIIINTFWS
jgi:hypothetical protein